MTGHTTHPAISRFGPRARVVGAAVVAIAMFFVPALLWSVFKPAAHSVEYAILGLATFVACPLVFQLLSRPHPGFGYGAVFAFVVAVGFAIQIGAGVFLGPLTVGAGLFGAIAVFLIVFITGLIGASIASLIARSLDPEGPGGRESGLRPWHFGAGIAVVELVSIALLPVLWR
jgi:hypothetical protein